MSGHQGSGRKLSGGQDMGLFGLKKNKSNGAPTLKDGQGSPPPSNASRKSPSTSKAGIVPLTASQTDIPLPKPPDPEKDPAAYLRSIYAVRERAQVVFDAAKKNQLRHFSVDLSKFTDTATYVVSVIKRDYAGNYAAIPPHGRWQHFDVGGRPRIDLLLSSWSSTVSIHERARRLIDLFVVSVLLDAGAGTRWSYKSKESGRVYRRSEGIAIASLEMFKYGIFSSNPSEPHQVDGKALKNLSDERLAKGLQITATNPIEGLEGRAALMSKLGIALENQEVFGEEARPGYLLDYLLSHPTTHASSVPIIALPVLWDTLMDALTPIWPDTRTQIDGRSLGDAWPCGVMPSDPNRPWINICPFHKLTQWLTYSLMAPMQRLLHVHFAGAGLLTGLPEYRNGGLLIDTGLLTLKEADAKRGLENFQANSEVEGQPNMEVVPLFTVDDDVIVEWRAVTIGFLDELLIEVNSLLGLSGSEKLNLAQMLEAGSWKGGRELAEVSRPNTKEPPIMIHSDGTVF